ncbi:NACHT, LRR and PYD domains-containing protein 12-like protein, partial [Lates japonicus]
HQTPLDSVFMLLEENIVTFMKNELKKIQRVLSPDYPECLESQREDEEVLDGEDEEQRRSSREAFLKITLNFLRRMKQEELADCLQSSGAPCAISTNIVTCSSPPTAAHPVRSPPVADPDGHQPLQFRYSHDIQY